jgi:Polyketide cyclase / dehydrase and lipid transport
VLKKIAIAIAVLLAAALLFATTKPDTFRVQRTTVIKAAPEKIFPFVNDFHTWVAWSPWEKMDPAMKRTLGGAASGKGAVYEWDGDGKVGAGRMEIVESAAPSTIVIKLDFIKPFEGHDIARFTMQPQGDSTTVTWSMEGPAPFITKVFQVFCDMDSMIGKDFEVGLASLKAIAEK